MTYEEALRVYSKLYRANEVKIATITGLQISTIHRYLVGNLSVGPRAIKKLNKLGKDYIDILGKDLDEVTIEPVQMELPIKVYPPKNVKKLFVSVPMRGRTDDQIKMTMNKLHRIAEVMIGEPLEMIDTIENDIPDKANVSVYCLGNSISKLAMADYFIGVNVGEFRDTYHGCIFEYDIAKAYDIPAIRIDPKYCDCDDIILLDGVRWS